MSPEASTPASGSLRIRLNLNPPDSMFSTVHVNMPPSDASILHSNLPEPDQHPGAHDHSDVVLPPAGSVHGAQSDEEQNDPTWQADFPEEFLDDSSSESSTPVPVTQHQPSASTHVIIQANNSEDQHHLVSNDIFAAAPEETEDEEWLENVPDTIPVGKVRFWPFWNKEKGLHDQSSAAAKRAFAAWVKEFSNKLDMSSVEQDPVASSAAKCVFTILATRKFSSPALVITLSVESGIGVASVELRKDGIKKIGEIVKGSGPLKKFWWHLFHVSTAENGAVQGDWERDICGYVGCGGKCVGHDPKNRALFSLNRIFKDCSRELMDTRNKTVMESARDGANPFKSLPDEIVHAISDRLSIRDSRAFANTSAYHQFIFKTIVPGLRLVLMDHQSGALDMMEKMERRVRPAVDMPLLNRIKVPGAPHVCLVVDMVEGDVLRIRSMPKIELPQGGLFCDEPGLGKTITALSLVLKTAGRKPKIPHGVIEAGVQFWMSSRLEYYIEGNVGRYESYGDGRRRAAPSRRVRLLPHSPTADRRSFGRRVRRTDFLDPTKGRGSLPDVEESDAAQSRIYLSPATLIIVPNVLTSHWIYQINTHVRPGSLRVLHVRSDRDLPFDVRVLAHDFDVVLVPFEVVGHLEKRSRRTAPLLMRVHFLRIIIDEGHKLSSVNVSQFSRACSKLRADSRWVMTGTPTPTTQKTDVDHLWSLLNFIREKTFGFDKKAWQVGVRDAYTSFRPECIDVLQALLKTVMIRADKSILPAKLHVKNVFLDFTKRGSECYNYLVSMARRNLITADWFSEEHKESLLNSSNLRQANAMVRNLRLASCSGGAQPIRFSEKDIIDSLDIIYERFSDIARVSDSDRFDDPTNEWPLISTTNLTEQDIIRRQGSILSRMSMLKKFMREGTDFTRLTRKLSKPFVGKAYVSRIYSGVLHDIAQSFLHRRAHCAGCYKFIEHPYVTPCAHLLCEECVLKDMHRCTAKHCGTPYRLDDKGVPEDFIELQPSIVSSVGWSPDWGFASAKMDYLINRIQSLPLNETWRDGERQPHLTKPKVIIHSNFFDHLNVCIARLKESPLKDSYIEMVRNEQERDVDLRSVRKASVFAQRSIEKFAKDPEISILIMNTRHGSVGLDLSFVQYIFLIEPVWDASVEMQILSRAHRIGCRKNIYVERLIMKNSVEDEMLKELEAHFRGETPPLNSEKGKKDMRRIRTVLLNLKPVAYAKVQHPLGVAGMTGGQSSGVKRKQPDPSNDGSDDVAIQVTAPRSVRARHSVHITSL